MSDVIPFPRLAQSFPLEGELAKRMLELVHSYDGEMSFAAAVGVVDLVRQQLINEALI